MNQYKKVVKPNNKSIYPINNRNKLSNICSILILIISGFMIIFSIIITLSKKEDNIIKLSNSQKKDNNFFILNIFQKTNEFFKNKNMIISPLSIYMVLGLTANGAKSQTQLEMINTLGSNSIEEINKNNKNISSIIKNYSTISIANAVMYKFEPLESFKRFSKIYDAEIKKLVSVDQVNNWCKEKTNGKIDKIIDTLSKDTIMILLNAIYFNGTWLNKFNKHLTIKKPFYNEQKTKNKSIDMMRIKKNFNYFENSDVQMIELPFDKDYMSAIILLPKSQINDFINSNKLELNLMNINEFKNEFVNLELPKFELSFESSIKDILKYMGIKLAFTSNADFSGIISSNDIYISEVLHKTYLKVNEDGTEAAAVTSVIMTRSAFIKKEKEYKMIVNKPFIFILRNKKLMDKYQYIFMAKICDIQ